MMDTPSAFAEERPRTVPGREEHGLARTLLRANTATFATFALGAIALSLFCPLGAGLYALYCVASTAAIWATVCVHCPHYGGTCPAGYGAMSSALFRRGREGLLASRHRLIWVYTAPAWLAPPLAATPVLVVQFSWPLLGLVLAFLVTAFVVAPVVSRVAGCCEYWRGVPSPGFGTKSTGGGSR